MSGFMMFGGKSRFPIINSPEIDREKMLFYLEKQLKYEGATQVERRGDLVLFTGVMFSFIRLRTFLQFGERGFVRVTTEGDRLIAIYRLSFIGIFLFYLVGGLFLTVIMWNSIITSSDSFTAISTFLFLVCISFGLNIFVRLVSLAMFIERTYDAFMRK